jgi:hypothetical protein
MTNFSLENGWCRIYAGIEENAASRVSHIGNLRQRPLRFRAARLSQRRLKFYQTVNRGIRTMEQFMKTLAVAFLCSALLVPLTPATAGGMIRRPPPIGRLAVPDHTVGRAMRDAAMASIVRKLLAERCAIRTRPISTSNGRFAGDPRPSLKDPYSTQQCRAEQLRQVLVHSGIASGVRNGATKMRVPPIRVTDR